MISLLIVIHGLEEKMPEEVKKLSEGKSFEEICNNIYHIENSSTKPTNYSPQTFLATVQAMGSMPSTTADGAEEEEVDAAEAEEEATPRHCAQPGAPSPPINQTGSTSAIFLWIAVPSARMR